MTKYRKKPVVIEAELWNGKPDHLGVTIPVWSHEGGAACPECDKPMTEIHGWIGTLEGGHRVCPGDWIITGTQGERYPCKADIFPEIYELA